jgi:RNA polymerase sigma factor (sigma-70 family)
MTAEMIERGRWLATHIVPCEPQLRGWLRRMVPPGLEIDDVIQESYTILSSLADVSQIDNPKAYFYQVVRSLIAGQLRQSSLVAGSALGDPRNLHEAHEGLTPERIVSGREELQRLYQAITQLPEPRRTIFIMRKINHVPQKVIAERLRISESVVENHIARGLRTILSHLSAEEGWAFEEDRPSGAARKSRSQRA